MGNTDKPEGEVKKKCPFSGEWCGDWCPLFTQLMRQVEGVVSKANMCTFVATNAILSDLNMKAPQGQPQKPNIILPGNRRSN